MQLKSTFVLQRFHLIQKQGSNSVSEGGSCIKVRYKTIYTFPVADFSTIRVQRWKAFFAMVYRNFFYISYKIGKCILFPTVHGIEFFVRVYVLNTQGTSILYDCIGKDTHER